MELELALNNIVRVDKKFISYLRGSDGKFTYDSPKFAEAVIRIARGSTPHIAHAPVIRIDEDVLPNAKSIQTLLEFYFNECKESSVFFFSGSYGNSEDDRWNPINDQAVRTHWFYGEETKIGEDGYPIIDKDKEKKIILKIKAFLSDFSISGAPQFPEGETTYSNSMAELILNSNRTEEARISPQVISGAGLIMSSKAIRFLPPFMNFNTLTTWVDDFLKRLLHEKIHDLEPNSPENIQKVKFIQQRHREYNQKEKIDESDVYFERLLRGCVMKACIQKENGDPTIFAKYIRDIVSYKAIVSDIALIQFDADEMQHELKEQMYSRYMEVLKCWHSSEFTNSKSYQWAAERLPENMNDIKSEPQKSDKWELFHKSLIEDLLGYIDLVKIWPILVRAIERLHISGNNWLFREA